ncbi:hypothetical protein CCACVL1_27546 [Corchorus capsularis]|uniref:Uncharacterized protein n=1 Tax=Corchorus capsularis TaxID=210143 RepID=A0A1R3G9U5_COCAP|nr:hypothetical protein CCACVL1_27546 [Corchorus capsularis]
MPPFARKLKPARKAWKSFTEKFRSKLHNFHVPSSIKAATNRFLEFCSHRLFTPFKKRFLSKYSSGGGRYGGRYSYDYDHLYHYQQHYQTQFQKNRKVIYIDQLYAEPPPPPPLPMQQAKRVESQAAETSRRNEAAAADGKVLRRKGKEKAKEEEEESKIDSIEDAWKAIVARSPHLRGVDERADEFIYKFREDRKLEKEISDLDFQEMLARSTA